MIIKTKEDIGKYHVETAEKVCDSILKNFHEASGELEKSITDGMEEPLVMTLATAHVSSYVKATSTALAGFVVMTCEGAPDEQYKDTKEAVLSKISEIMDEMREISKGRKE